MIKESIEERFERFIYHSPDGCWYWTGAVNSVGYGQMNISKSTKIASRVSFQLFKGNPDGFVVCHRCDNRICVNPDHLFLGSYKDNTQDMFKKGRNRSGRAKVSKDDIIEIRKITSLTQTEIANMYGLKQAAVSKIKKRVTWAHIKD